MSTASSAGTAGALDVSRYGLLSLQEIMQLHPEIGPRELECMKAWGKANQLVQDSVEETTVLLKSQWTSTASPNRLCILSAADNETDVQIQNLSNFATKYTRPAHEYNTVWDT